jgi:hypothetical protein
MRWLRAKWGWALLQSRVFDLKHEHTADPFAPDYLYLVQQQKRLSLSKTVGSLRPRNLPLIPFILMAALLRYLDLLVTNQITRSFINEEILKKGAVAARKDQK